VRDISTSVYLLVVMLSYIISTCDNKEPPVALYPSSTSLHVCREYRAKTRLTRLCMHIGLGLGFQAAPCLVRGLSGR
jgi:hypothetical protein